MLETLFAKPIPAVYGAIWLRMPECGEPCIAKGGKNARIAYTDLCRPMSIDYERCGVRFDI